MIYIKSKSIVCCFQFKEPNLLRVVVEQRLSSISPHILVASPTYSTLLLCSRLAKYGHLNMNYEQTLTINNPIN